MSKAEANEMVPAIRFDGFDQAWVESQLENEVLFYSGLTYSPTNIVSRGGTLVLRSSNVKGGDIVTLDNVYVNSEVVNCDNVRVGDIIVVVRNGSRSLIGKHAQIKNGMENTVIGAFMTGIHTNQPEFINALLDTKQFNAEIEKNLGATINQITTGAFKQMVFHFTTSEEQTKIGAYFQELDTLIAGHRGKQEKLLQLKKALLEKMFPKQDQNKPEIRFAGFNENWVEERLGLNANFGKGQGYSKGDLVDGGVPIILYGQLYTNFRNEIFDVDTFVVVQGKSVFSKGGEVIVPASGESAEDIARASVVVKSDVVLGGDLNVIYPDETLVSNFLALTISNGKVQRDLAKKAQGKSVVHVRNSDLQNLDVPYPGQKEQTKIGELFKQMDELIDQHQTQITKLLNIKQACLAKMFV